MCTTYKGVHKNMETLAIKLKDILVSYQSKDILDIKELSAYQGDVIGVIGRNGSGKSTLLKVIAGEIEPEGALVQREVTFNYQPQIQEVDETYRVDVLQPDLMSRLQIPKNAVESLSGGEKHKYRLLQTLSVYELGLLLDEPTTHLDKTSVDDLIEELRYYYGTLVIVSHDRYFLNQLANKIWEVADGKVIEYSGNYDDYMEQKEQQIQQQEEAYKQYQQEKNRLEKAAQKKEMQAQKAAKASSKQNNRSIKPDRLSSSKQKDTVQKAMHKSAKAIEKRIEQLDDVEGVVRHKNIVFPSVKHLQMHNDFPIRGYNIQLTRGDKLLIEGGSFQIPLGKKVAIIGDNGTGKSTLLNHILNGGEGVTLSPKVEFGVYQQLDYQLETDVPLLTYLLKQTEFDEAFVRAVLSNLGFKQMQVMTPLNKLSGGEATRVAMAEMFVKASNVLILDEPTNFIDVFTIEALENFIQKYPGTVIFTSHDKEFVNRAADQVYQIAQEKLIHLR